MKRTLPRLVIIGHTQYSLNILQDDSQSPFGEINNAAKLHRNLKDCGFDVTEVLDIYELFGIVHADDPNIRLIIDMTHTNRMLAEVGQELITDYDNEPVRKFRNNLLSILSEKEDNILLLLTWPAETLKLLSTGIQRRCPVIAKEYSYMRGYYQYHSFPLGNFSSEVDVVISESLLGCFNSMEAGVPLGSFSYLPNLAPSESACELVQGIAIQDYRRKYVSKLAGESGSNINIEDNTLIIGCPSRCVRGKNVELLIHVVNDLYKEFPNILLILKGNLSSEFDNNTLYTEKLHQLIKSAQQEPWFLWDPSHTPYPEILNIFRCFDLCSVPSGAEIGSNTLVELCTLGIPCVILEASVNPYLYRGMAEFVDAGDFTFGYRLSPQPNITDYREKLKGLITDPQKRQKMGSAAKELARKRFSSEQLEERMELIINAAMSYHRKDNDKEHYRKLITDKFQHDIKEYRIPKELYANNKF